MPPNDFGFVYQCVLMGAAFALVLCLWMMGVMLWRSRQGAREERLQRRLELISEPNNAEGRILRLWADGKEATTIVPGRANPMMMSQLERMRRIAGIRTPVATMAIYVLGAAGLTMAVAWVLTNNILVSGCGAIAVVLVAWIYVRQRISQRVTLFEGQLVDALDLASRSLRAGHPLPGAFRLISEEIPAPVGAVFSDICQQQGLGVALDEAIRRAAEISPSPDLKLFATSVIIQMRSGGNLADMMERLAAVIRDRMRLTRRVRVLNAQTQFSKRILVALPFAIFVILNLLNPAYMMPLYSDPAGQLWLTVAAGLLLLGVWIMNKMTVIKY